MTKERTSLSLDPDVAEYLRRDSVNASGLVNQLVKRHMSGGASEDEIRKFRMEQLREEYEDAASKARRKIERYNELEQRGDKIQTEREKKVEELLDMVEDMGATLHKDTPKVESLANEYFNGEIDTAYAELVSAAEDRAEITSGQFPDS